MSLFILQSYLPAGHFHHRADFHIKQIIVAAASEKDARALAAEHARALLAKGGCGYAALHDVVDYWKRIASCSPWTPPEVGIIACITD